MELDLNNDFQIDSKINLKNDVRENLIHGYWHKDVSRQGGHGILVRGIWHEVEFEKGNWVIQL